MFDGHIQLTTSRENTKDSSQQFEINNEDRHEDMTNEGISFEDIVGQSF